MYLSVGAVASRSLLDTTQLPAGNDGSKLSVVNSRLLVWLNTTPTVVIMVSTTDTVPTINLSRISARCRLFNHYYRHHIKLDHILPANAWNYQIATTSISLRLSLYNYTYICLVTAQHSTAQHSTAVPLLYLPTIFSNSNTWQWVYASSFT